MFDLRGDGQQSDVSRGLLFQGGREVRDEYADETSQFAVDLSQLIVYCDKAPREILVYSSKKIAAD
jgi:hypothetical protein